MAKTTALSNSLLNLVLRNQAYTAPTTVYAALYVGNPLSGGTEVTGGSYARQAATFGAAASGQVQNTNSIAFASMPAQDSTHQISYVAICDAVSAGNILYTLAATASKTTNAGDTVNIAVGGLTVTEG